MEPIDKHSYKYADIYEFEDCGAIKGCDCLPCEARRETYEELRDKMNGVDRLGYSQLVIKAIAAYLAVRVGSVVPLLLMATVDMMYLQFERNLRGVTAYKFPVVTFLYYVALLLIVYGW